MTQPKVLVVDDEEVIRFALKDYLENRDFMIAEAGDCQSALAACGESPSSAGEDTTQFDGSLALAAVQAQLDFGPRVPGTESHAACADWLVSELGRYADSAFADRWVHTTASGDSLPLANIHAVFNPRATRRALLCAHWDTRPISDHDPDPAVRGDGLMDAPQKIVCEFEGARGLEAGHIEALGADAAGQHADRSVLAGGVDPLEDDHDGPLGLRKQPVGEFVERVAMPPRLLLGRRAVEAVVNIGVEIGQTDVAAGRQGKGLGHRESLRGPDGSKPGGQASPPA